MEQHFRSTAHGGNVQLCTIPLLVYIVVVSGSLFCTDGLPHYNSGGISKVSLLSQRCFGPGAVNGAIGMQFFLILPVASVGMNVAIG